MLEGGFAKRRIKLTTASMKAAEIRNYLWRQCFATEDASSGRLEKLFHRYGLQGSYDHGNDTESRRHDVFCNRSEV